MKEKVRSFFEYFYPPFRKVMSLQTFTYAACGGANTLMGLLIYAVSLQYIFTENVFYFGISAFKPHNAALFLSSCVVFIVGFMLNKYIVFTGSNIKGRIQLFRYFLSFFFNLVINYFLLKLLVEGVGWDPFFSQLITTALIIAISYLTQKHFSFKVRAEQ
ncbi:MAG: GtrA family protein [Ferruginibacter sp.]